MPDDIILNAESGAESQPAGNNGLEDGVNLENPPAGAEKAGEKEPPSKYSERLNKDREKIRKEIEDEYAPFKKDAERLKEVERKLKAIEEGKTVEDIAAEEAEQEKLRREMLENSPEYLSARKAAIEFQEQKIVSELQKQFPDDNITELTDEFRAILMAGNGALSPVEVHMILKNRIAAGQPPKKEPIGSVKTDGKVIEKEFYTSEEIDAFTREDYKKIPGLREKVRNSLLRLGK